jgi:hypothetical protein
MEMDKYLQIVQYNGRTYKFLPGLNGNNWIWWNVEYFYTEDVGKDRNTIWSLLKAYNASYAESGLTLAEFINAAISDK